MSLVALPDRVRHLTLSDLRGLPPVLTAEEAAPLWGISVWSLYEASKRGGAPVAPLRIGRSLRWPTAAVLRSIDVNLAEVLGP